MAVDVKTDEFIVLGLSLDFESTGLNVSLDQITEFGIAIIGFTKNDTVCKLPNEFRMRVKVNRQISVASQRITNITNEQLNDELPFDDVLEKCTEFITQSCEPFGRDVTRALITQGGKDFDIPLLIHELHRNGKTPNLYLRRWRVTSLVDMLPFCRNPTLLDNTKLMRNEFGRPIFKLGDVYEMLVGKPLVGAHGALQDALGVCEILQHSASLRKAVLDDVRFLTYNYVVNLERFITTLMSESFKAKPKTITKPVRTIDTFFLKRQKTDTGSNQSSSLLLSSSSCSSSTSNEDSSVSGS